MTHAPVLAVSGWSGSGKTTLLESALPRLVARGLSIAVVKHDAHGLAIDHPGKDSDRLFRAGAEIVACGPGEILARRHASTAPSPSIDAIVEELAGRHDLVLAEGHRGTPLTKVWLASATDPHPPSDAANVIATLPWSESATPAARSAVPSRLDAFLAVIDAWLPEAWLRRPLAGGILVGGRSSRMGSPKQLLRAGGVTLFDRAWTALTPMVTRIVALGAGELPSEHQGVARLADPPGLSGPLAGLLAALRWAPATAFLVTACDHPFLGHEAMRWLAGERAPGRWIIMPRLAPGSDRVEPFPGLYEAPARVLLEALAARREAGPSALAGLARVHSPVVPPALAAAWRNVNRPEEIDPAAG